ncbi:MAG: TlpA family protein disulfide reductase [Candidatus Synoicihabitans palmerolidicus]|nr:TlpA family protein disulfide reductase [Candidatus Synoicihabitans palmerolidicus]
MNHHLQGLLLAGVLATSGFAATEPNTAKELTAQQVVLRDLVPHFYAAAQALGTGQQIDFEPFDAAFRQCLVDWPETEAGWQLMTTYLLFRSCGLPERTEVDFLKTFVDSPNHHTRGFARNRLALAALELEPLEFRFTAIDGQDVDMAALRGKVVLIDFWASWCAPCIAALPEVKRVYTEFHDEGFEVIGVAFDRASDREKFIALVAEQALPWPQKFAGPSWGDDFARRFTVTAIPATFLFDQTGRLVASQFDGPELADAVTRLLQ